MLAFRRRGEHDTQGMAPIRDIALSGLAFVQTPAAPWSSCLHSRAHDTVDPALRNAVIFTFYQVAGIVHARTGKALRALEIGKPCNSCKNSHVEQYIVCQHASHMVGCPYNNDTRHCAVITTTGDVWRNLRLVKLLAEPTWIEISGGWYRRRMVGIVESAGARTVSPAWSNISDQVEML